MASKEVFTSASSQAEHPLSASKQPSLQFNSGGYFLSLPPTPFSAAPEPPKFIFLDDQNSTFHSIDYASPCLRNTTSWKTLNLHRVPDAAIIFPSTQWALLTSHNNDNNNNTALATGFLVSIYSCASSIITATKVGTVHVQRIARELMNLSALESLKGAVIGGLGRGGWGWGL